MRTAFRTRIGVNNLRTLVLETVCRCFKRVRERNCSSPGWFAIAGDCRAVTEFPGGNSQA